MKKTRIYFITPLFAFLFTILSCNFDWDNDVVRHHAYDFTDGYKVATYEAEDGTDITYRLVFFSDGKVRFDKVYYAATVTEDITLYTGYSDQSELGGVRPILNSGTIKVTFDKKYEYDRVYGLKSYSYDSSTKSLDIRNKKFSIDIPLSRRYLTYKRID